jgi:hypothetical protein
MTNNQQPKECSSAFGDQHQAAPVSRQEGRSLAMCIIPFDPKASRATLGGYL